MVRVVFLVSVVVVMVLPATTAAAVVVAIVVVVVAASAGAGPQLVREAQDVVHVGVARWPPRGFVPVPARARG